MMTVLAHIRLIIMTTHSKLIHVYFSFEPPPNSHTRSLSVKEISKKFCFYTISQQTHDIISGSSSDMKSIP